MKLTKVSTFVTMVFLGSLVAPLVYSKSPYAGNQGSSNTTPVHGYTKKDGTYVAPYQRTTPNGTQKDNWSSKPNVNPYTGKEGAKEPQK